MLCQQNTTRHQSNSRGTHQRQGLQARTHQGEMVDDCCAEQLAEQDEEYRIPDAEGWGHPGDRQDIEGDEKSCEVKLRRVPGNPAERARVNAMNTRLLTGDGVIRLMVDPARAPNVVKDLEGVRTLAGGSGEIDKKATPALTHISDGLGYYVEAEFPVAKRAAVVTPLRM